MVVLAQCNSRNSSVATTSTRQAVGKVLLPSLRHHKWQISAHQSVLACGKARTARLNRLRTQDSMIRGPGDSTTSMDQDNAPEILPEGVDRLQNVPKRVAIFVEPSPFTYVCGYKNRFCTMIKYLVEEGCDVLVITTGKGITLPGTDTSSMVEQPAEFHGARVVSAFSFGCPWYWQLPLSFALSPRIFNILRDFKPDLIHCSSPGVMVLAVKLYAALLRLPLVLSYHTHVPSYLPKYKIDFLVPALWLFLRMIHWTVHLTLTTSDAMQTELVTNNVSQQDRTHVWKKGVDSEAFHPRFKCTKMRERLTGGHPSDPVMVYVGRLGHEKNLKFLKGILEKQPSMRLAFVGDGPARAELQEHFKGTKTAFLGMLHGDELSASYASADVFVMPSESETLGFVVLEAMACGLPVVAVRAGGIPDIITQNGVTGFLYAPGDLDTAAELVDRLITDKELAANMAVAARQEVSRWDWRAATQYLLYMQYPLAVAAAVRQYGPKLGELASSSWGSQAQAPRTAYVS